MAKISSIAADQRGGVGKFFVVTLGVLVILGVAVFALWKPVIVPMVGDAVPERLTVDTNYQVPQEGPSVTFNVPAQWVVQRGLFKPQEALIQTPDLVMSIEVATWPGGSAPSFAAGLTEAVADYAAVEPAKTEVISESVLLHYSLVTVGETPKLVGTIGQNSTEELSKKASALITVEVQKGELEAYLPTLAALLKNVQVNQ